MDLSVICLSRTLEHFEGLAANLKPELAAFGGRVEPILVNNAATLAPRTGYDALTATAIRAGWAALEPGRNTSFAEGNNLAAKAASGEWLLLVNDDLRFEPGALARLWRQRGAADVLGCLIVESNGRVNHAGTRLVPWPDHLGRGDERSKWERPEVAPVQAVTFACVLMPREVFTTHLGGLDERFHYGFEDTDFCVRALEAGLRIKCVRDAVAIHDECGTRPRHGADDSRNGQLYAQKWSGKVEAIVRSRGLL